MSRVHQRGVTMIEVLVSLALASSLSAIAVVRLREFEHRASSTAGDVSALLKRARAKAITSVRTFTVKPLNDGRIITTWGSTCAGTQSTDAKLTYDLPPDTKLADTTWSVCYSNRGISSSSATIVVQDTKKQESKSVQVVVGGGVRIL